MLQTFQEFIFYETPSVCKAILNSCAHQTKNMNSEMKDIQILSMNSITKTINWSKYC